MIESHRRHRGTNFRAIPQLLLHTPFVIHTFTHNDAHTHTDTSPPPWHIYHRSPHSFFSSSSSPPRTMTSMIDSLQQSLNFAQFTHNPAFKDNRSIGRIGVAGFLLGIIGGVHVTLLLLALTSSSSFSSLWGIRWCLYMVSLCLFHFMEFLTTALYKPETVTYDCTYTYRFVVIMTHTYTLPGRFTSSSYLPPVIVHIYASYTTHTHTHTTSTLLTPPLYTNLTYSLHHQPLQRIHHGSPRRLD